MIDICSTLCKIATKKVKIVNSIIDFIMCVRYYYDDIREVMKKNKITSVLFLYNGNTFVQDNSISGVLQND